LIRNSIQDSSVGEEDMYKSKKEKPILVSELYSELDTILVNISGYFFCLISYYLLAI